MGNGVWTGPGSGGAPSNVIALARIDMTTESPPFRTRSRTVSLCHVRGNDIRSNSWREVSLAWSSRSPARPADRREIESECRVDVTGVESFETNRLDLTRALQITDVFEQLTVLKDPRIAFETSSKPLRVEEKDGIFRTLDGLRSSPGRNISG